MIRNYLGKDMHKIIKLWNEILYDNKITEKDFIKSILLDINFDPKGFFVYEINNEIKGFIYSTVRKVPIDVGGTLDKDKGWIVAMAVCEECFEIAPKLLSHAEDFINKDNKRTIYACQYTPNYFFQGINKKYQKYVELFDNLGYKRVEDSVSMAIDLTTYNTPDFVGTLRNELKDNFITTKKLSYDNVYDFIHCLNKPGWAHRFRRLLNENMDLNQVSIALYKDEVIGCNIFGDPHSTPERFGPFGVRDDFQGKGIGKLLLDDCLCEMKKRGLKKAWMQSSSSEEHVVRLYKKYGFNVTGEYLMYERDMKNETK